MINREPQRVLGLGNVLFAGYNAALGLEHINGPDAVFDKKYRVLCDELKLPFNDWGWRMVFDNKQLTQYSNALNLLGVGVVLSSSKIPEAKDLKYIDRDNVVYAYVRSNVWPRAFYTNNIVTYNSVAEFVKYINDGNGHPFVAINSKDVDSLLILQKLLHKSHFTSKQIVKANNYLLTNNTTHFTIHAPASGIVYLAEAGDPKDFIVTINGKKALLLTANYAFKAVVVEKPGTYRVVFKYWPAHLTLYLLIAILGLILWVASLFVFWSKFKKMKVYHDCLKGKYV